MMIGAGEISDLKHKEFYVIVKSTVGAGLGDRIRAVLSAILYAQHSGRHLNVMWDDGLYGPEGENVFPHLLELRDIPTQPLPFSNNLEVRPALWRGELHHPMKVLYRRHGPERWNRSEVIKRFSFDQSRLAYEEEVLVMWEFDQFGDCCNPPISWTNQRFVKELAKRHLVPSKAVKRALDAYRTAHFRPAMIGVHVRHSHEELCRKKLVAESQYHALIRKIRGQHPEAGIFLATDNIDVERRFRDRYGDSVVTTDKWFGSAGEPLHLSERRGDRLQNAVEALVDMFLLASCSHLIFPGWSSFSLVASYFSSASEQNIFALKNLGGIYGRFQAIRFYLPWRLSE